MLAWRPLLSKLVNDKTRIVGKSSYLFWRGAEHFSWGSHFKLIFNSLGWCRWCRTDHNRRNSDCGCYNKKTKPWGELLLPLGENQDFRWKNRSQLKRQINFCGLHYDVWCWRSPCVANCFLVEVREIEAGRVRMLSPSFRLLKLLENLNEGTLGFSVLRVWLFFRSVFRFLCHKTFKLVFRFWCSLPIWVAVSLRSERQLYASTRFI